LKRVLVVAYYFPPIGGGGVQRTVKFCRYLLEFGYQPVVVTGPGGATDIWAPEDATLAHEIPPEVEVHRVPGPEPAALAKWRRRADRMLDLTPATLRWWVDGATSLGRSVGRDADLVFGELVPYATARAAARVAADLRKPWVADLQDPWALDEMWLYPSLLHRRRDTARMRRLLGSARAIVMNTPEASARVRGRFPELADRVVEAIPNGYDPADFERAEPTSRQERRFRIVHTGTMHTEWGLQLRRMRRLRRLLGGMPEPGVDFLTRSHVFLLEAVERLLERDPTLRDVIEVHLAGALTEADRAVAARSPVTRLHGYVSHSGTISLMLAADLLFLPMHDLPAGVRAGLVPGKAYEYLGSGRPILAAVPEGDARDLLVAAGNASICSPGDVAAMAELLSERIAAWRDRREPAPPDPDVLAPFGRRAQAERLARVFDNALGERATALSPAARGRAVSNGARAT